MIDSLQKGDKILTSGGIIGTVVGVETDKVVIKVGGNDNLKLEIAKGYVVSKFTEGTAA
jgi:preprotein translocase subunit YajC